MKFNSLSIEILLFTKVSSTQRSWPRSPIVYGCYCHSQQCWALLQRKLVPLTIMKRMRQRNSFLNTTLTPPSNNALPNYLSRKYPEIFSLIPSHTGFGIGWDRDGSQTHTSSMQMCMLLQCSWQIDVSPLPRLEDLWFMIPHMVQFPGT